MSVFLWSDELPIVLQFDDVGPELLKDELRLWIERRQRLEIKVEDDPPVSFGGEREVIINLAAVRVFQVTNYAPATDKALLRLPSLDLKAN